MTLRTLAVLGLVALPLAACATVPEAAPPPVTAVTPEATPAERLRDLFARSDAAFLDRNPSTSFSRGDYSRADRITNRAAPDYYAVERHAAEVALAELATIDRAALGPVDQIAYDVFAYDKRRWLAGTEAEVAKFRHALVIDHRSGEHITYPRLASAGGQMPFATVADYENALKRHAAFARVLDDSIARLREGMAAGVVHPRVSTEIMIAQLDTQLKMRVEEMPYWTPVAAFPDAIGAADRARLTLAFRRAIETDIRPALQRLRTFLAEEYLPRSRDSVGLGGAPGGDAYYRYRVAEMTTLPLTPDEIHATGLAEVDRIEQALAAARAEAGDRKPVVYKDKASLTQAWYALQKRVDPLLPRLFATIPKTPLEIRPYEEYREAFNLAASYNSGDVNTGKPGIFYFSGYNLENREVSPTVSLYMHEGSPGHHFQNMTAAENRDLPDFLRFGGFTAYGEGWGLYAESLGYELGLYDDPVERIGALAGGELLRAVRLVVDTGLHAKGWSRQQAIDYMVAHGQPRDLATSETDRYIVMPGQALAYKVGELRIKAMRARAEAALGPRFDVRRFHSQVLETADLPLAVLEAKIDAWIAAGGP
ncbi:hypothetical protein A6F68_02782 [Tsuneonella dongtanensis]|uniref:DUF885 domain-containing protein n=1 Tax=Tsuneonella dongtanensis TaxID=692370 RepID=A0A1B2AGK2_9SPHN|nr:DUF885 domain-containing protein [Tsuneonella dongtanensis]ANY21272.1 hypothetical protein A6F68_02782 [Tsuneonella dongtanensis]